MNNHWLLKYLWYSVIPPVIVLILTSKQNYAYYIVFVKREFYVVDEILFVIRPTGDDMFVHWSVATWPIRLNSLILKCFNRRGKVNKLRYIDIDFDLGSLRLPSGWKLLFCIIKLFLYTLITASYSIRHSEYLIRNNNIITFNFVNIIRCKTNRL